MENIEDNAANIGNYILLMNDNRNDKSAKEVIHKIDDEKSAIGMVERLFKGKFEHLDLKVRKVLMLGAAIGDIKCIAGCIHHRTYCKKLTAMSK